jgi:CelD/BcsL family acetyltransferase involved in cellulose biosynthesis
VAQWAALLEDSAHANVYHQPALVRAWAETHGRALGAEPLFALASNSSGARVLLPLVVVTQRGRRTARRSLTAAGESFFGYHDPLVSGGADAADWIGFWNAVRRETASECDQALLRFVHQPFAAGPLAASGEPTPVLDLSGSADLDDVLARCSANHRGDVRRRLRRIREEGHVTLAVHDSASLDAAVRDFTQGFVPAYSAYWRARPEGCMLDRPGVADFVNRVLGDGLRGGWAHYAVLKIGDRPIAWHLGLTFRDALYWWIPAHDEVWQTFSPGKVLLAELIAGAIRSGTRTLHFLTGVQRYKLDWKPDLIPLSAVRWHAPSAKGTVLAWYDAGSRLMPR